MPSVSGAGRRRLPLGLQPRERRLGRDRVGVEHGHEAVLLDDRHSVQLRRLGRVDAHERRTVGRRPQDPRVEQARAGGRRRRSGPRRSPCRRRRGAAASGPSPTISDAARSTAFSSSVRVIDWPFASAP